MLLRVLLLTLPLWWAMPDEPADSLAPVLYTHDREAGPGHAVAYLTSRVLFNAGRSQQGAPLLAYGYLSRVAGLQQESGREEDELSAVMTFVVEGRVSDIGQSETTFMVKSEGSLRVFFAPQTRRDFSQPDSFRHGEEVATYNLKRYVFFGSTDERLRDRSFASLVSSSAFSFKGVTVDLRRLWGTQLVIEAQARGRETLPSPLPEYSAAVPYKGAFFIGGERTERSFPSCQELTCLSRGRQGTGRVFPELPADTPPSTYLVESKFFCARGKFGLMRKAASNSAAASGLRPRRR